MAEQFRPSPSEIDLLLEEASHIQKLEKHGLSLVAGTKKSEGPNEVFSVQLYDIATKYQCVEIEVIQQGGKVIASRATLEKAFTGLGDKQRAIVVANIFNYAEGTDPLIKYNFAQTIDREEQEIALFRNDIKNKPSRMLRDLIRALKE